MGEDSTGSQDVVPIVEDDEFFTAQGVAILRESVFGNDEDPDGGELTVTQWDSVSAAGGAAAVGDNGDFSYDPPEGFWGLDELAYTAVDDEGNEASATVHIFVSLRNATAEQIAGGQGGFAMYGGETGERSGGAVGGGGDVTGDGILDILIGARRADNQTGRVAVVSGPPSLTPAILDAEIGVSVLGAGDGQNFGSSLAYAGDVNGDGAGDLVVGTRGAEQRAYVVFGGGDLADLSMEALGEHGFEIEPGSDGGELGSSVHAAGDVNGDGLADVIVGSYNNTGLGSAYVVFGKADVVPVEVDALGTGGFTIRDETNGSSDSVGLAVSGGGDFNGDGLSDLVVADESWGGVYIVFGADATDAVDLGALGDRGMVIEAPSDETGFGTLVAMAGDVNGDGLADVIVAGDESAEVVVVFGAAGSADVNIDVLGDRGFRIETASAAVVNGAGDVNGDDRADVVIGTAEAGAFVVYGRAATTTVSVLDGEFDGFSVTTNESYVTGVGAGGDIDGDGVGDVIIGVPQYSLAAEVGPSPGASQLGSTGGPLAGGGPGQAVGATYVIYGVRTQ